MKVLAFIISAFAIFDVLHAASSDEDLAGKVKHVVDEILDVLPESVALKNYVITVPANDIVNGEVTIGEISISGVKDLKTILNYDEDASRLNYTFNMEDVAFVFDVTTKLTGLITLDHNLSIHVDLQDLKNEGYAIVSTDDKEVTDFNILVSLGDAVFDIQGLLDNDGLSRIVSEFLSNNVADIINEFNPTIAPFFSKIVMDIINIALKTET